MRTTVSKIDDARFPWSDHRQLMTVHFDRGLFVEPPRPASLAAAKSALQTFQAVRLRDVNIDRRARQEIEPLP